MIESSDLDDTARPVRCAPIADDPTRPTGWNQHRLLQAQMAAGGISTQSPGMDSRTSVWQPVIIERVARIAIPADSRLILM